MAINPRLRVTQPRNTTVSRKNKGGTVTGRLDWGAEFSQQTTKKLSRAQKLLDIEVMKSMQPYMQLETGAMINSMQRLTEAGSGQIRVNTPYAKRVFYSQAPIGRKTGRLRGGNYFNRMKADKLKYLYLFLRKVLDI